MVCNRLGFSNRIAEDAELNWYIESICREMKDRQPMYEMAVRSHALGMLVCLLRRHIRSDRSLLEFTQNMERYARIRPAVQLMSQRMGERITLTDLAVACHMSDAHFCRLFRQITGVTPVRYLLDLRLQEAATMLRRTEKTVTQVACEVGFDDSGYFSKKFREQFGMTPSKAKKIR
jgi:transcriptional regulator GlxA family with amidase domain